MASPYCECGNFVEGSTGFCPSCNREARRAQERSEKAQEKRSKALEYKMPRRSQKRAREERIYQKEVGHFLKGHRCEVRECKRRASEVHHKKGRIGDLLLDKKYWFRVCTQHHRQITDDSAWAIREGYSVPRNQ